LEERKQAQELNHMSATNSGTTAVGSILSNGGLGTAAAGGLGTGLNVQQVVAAQIQADSAPLILLQNRQTALNAQSSALNSMEVDVSNLQAAVFNLTDFTGGLNAQQANSSDPSVLTATAGTSAQAATHNIVVKSLATTASYYSNPAALQATASTPLATGGSFTINAGANSATIAINSTNNTLTGVASAINNSTAGASVTASIITDSSGARLAIVGNSSGTADDFTITDTGNSTGLNLTKAASGADASLSVDNIPISSASNTVTGAIQGVTLNLASAKLNETVSLNVTPDTTEAGTAISQFVSAYNTVVGDLNSQFAINPTTGSAGILSTDSTLSLVQDQLLTAINATSAGSVANLGSIGINLQNDGTLAIDVPTLTNALNSNFSAIQNFFQSTSSGVGQALTSGLTNIADPTQGTISMDLKGITQQQTDLASQILDIQANLTQEQQTLIAKYSSVNVILQQLPALQQQISSQLAGA
jgi:flagellar hook-associated protein 2